MKTCIATFEGLNISIKAQRALIAAGIGARIVSIDPSLTRRGCAWGVELGCEHRQRAVRVLRALGVTPGQFLENAEGRPL